MSQWQKLLDKIYSLSGDVRYNDLKKILLHFGYKEEKGTGSHRVFRRQGFLPVTIPEHKTIKKVYIKQAKDAIKKIQEQMQKQGGSK